MVKIANNRADGFVNRPDAQVRVVLVYGPDEGLVRERVVKLCRTVVADLDDPFRVADFDAAGLKEDPARLLDEACAIPMTGGRRVVRLRGVDEGSVKAVTALLQTPTASALVVLQAGDLSSRSDLRKLLEEADEGAAIACYLDDPEAVEGVVRAFLKAEGLAIERDALEVLIGLLGGDRQQSRSEIEKLALYKATGTVTVSDVEACIGDVSALSLDALVYAVAEGDSGEAQRLADRLLAEGEAPIRVLRVIAGHFLRLHRVVALVADGRKADQVVAGFKPPLFFKVRDRFLGHVRQWPLDRLGQAVEALLQAEIDCKSTGSPAPEIMGRVIIQVSRAARRSARPSPP